MSGTEGGVRQAESMTEEVATIGNGGNDHAQIFSDDLGRKTGGNEKRLKKKNSLKALKLVFKHVIKSQAANSKRTRTKGGEGNLVVTLGQGQEKKRRNRQSGTSKTWGGTRKKGRETTKKLLGIH